MRLLAFFVVVFLTFTTVKAQDSTKNNTIEKKDKTDTIKPADYINLGKIAGQKAARRSLIFPGLGQIYNYGLVVKDVQSGAVKGKKVAQKVYIVAKLGAIYAGGVILAKSYVDNSKNYRLFLNELQYRQLNNNRPSPDNGLEQYRDTNNLLVAKNIFKRNREIVLISFAGLYGLNVLDAYVTARLKYFNVDERLAFKVSPSFVQPQTMYGFGSPAPALKLSLKL
jgi:hypothetical protein